MGWTIIVLICSLILAWVSAMQYTDISCKTRGHYRTEYAYEADQVAKEILKYVSLVASGVCCIAFGFLMYFAKVHNG